MYAGLGAATFAMPEKAPSSGNGSGPRKRFTFDVHDAVAWDIQGLAHEEKFRWPGFGPDLRTKLNDFLSQIV
jgi:hypothetical protein